MFTTGEVSGGRVIREIRMREEKGKGKRRERKEKKERKKGKKKRKGKKGKRRKKKGKEKKEPFLVTTNECKAEEY